MRTPDQVLPPSPSCSASQWQGGNAPKGHRNARKDHNAGIAWSLLTVLLSYSQEELEQQLWQWQEFYNQERTHTALHCKTPQQRLEEVRDLIATLESIQAAYHPEKESYKSNHYYWATPEKT